MQIQVLSVTTETKPTAKGSYQQSEVAYKNLSFQGKVEAKKLMSFGAQAEAFKAMATAQTGQVYEIDVVKNDKGYNDWIKVMKSDGGAIDTTAQQTTSGVRTAGATPAPKSTYETPAERAKKQIYIVRQSSISNAIDLLSVGAKSQPKIEAVIEAAKQFEEFVFGNGSTDSVVTKDVSRAGSIEEIEDDIPY